MASVLSAWQTWALLSAVFAAATAVLAKVGVTGLDADLATVVRTAVVLVLSALIVSARGAWRFPSGWTAASVTTLVLSGCATAASWLCYFRALKLGPASRVAPIDKLSIVLVIVVAAVVLGEPVGWRVALGAVLITIGAIVIATA